MDSLVPVILNGVVIVLLCAAIVGMLVPAGASASTPGTWPPGWCSSTPARPAA